MFNFNNPENKVLVYAEDAFSNKAREKFPLRAKTADGYIRYADVNILGVIESTSNERNVKGVLGIREDIPIYKSIEEYIQNPNSIKIDVLMIGIAPSGGDANDKILGDIRYAIRNGINIMSGMHYELNKDNDILSLAKEFNVEMWDVRVPPDSGIEVASCKAYFVGNKKPILLTCAADAAIGKMTLGLEIERRLNSKGIKGELIATGQTAIMIKGKGISIDRVIGDFMPGAVEKLVLDASEDNRFLIIEGQGGLAHPGYAPVTLALLHGGMPTHTVLVYRPQRKHSIGSKLIKLPSVLETIDLYKRSSLQIRVPEFIGVAMHTQGLSDAEAQDEIRRVKEETNLPAEDVIRFPDGSISDAFEKVVLNYPS